MAEKPKSFCYFFLGPGRDTTEPALLAVNENPIQAYLTIIIDWLLDVIIIRCDFFFIALQSPWNGYFRFALFSYVFQLLVPGWNHAGSIHILPEPFGDC